MDDSPIERALYNWQFSITSWSRGKIQVTDQRVLVGAQVWPIADVQDVYLATMPHESRRMPSDGNPADAGPGCWLGLLGLLGAALLLATDATGWLPHPLIRLAVVLLFALSAGGVIFSLALTIPLTQVYRLVLVDRAGAPQVADAIWWALEDRWYAEQAVTAIRTAIALEAKRLGGLKPAPGRGTSS